MKQDVGPEVEKSEKTFINKRQTSIDHRQNLVTLDNTRKEIISIEKKCEKNQVKYDYLSSKNVKRLVEEYLQGLHDDVNRKKYEHESKLSGTIEVSQMAMEPSLQRSKTSSAMVCWSTSSDDYNLEIFGPLYISPRHTIVPLEPSAISHQRFIHLG